MAREIKQLDPLKDGDLMPFGKHKGDKMIDIPAKYLLYMYENSMISNSRVLVYVKENLDVIKEQAKQE